MSIDCENKALSHVLTSNKRLTHLLSHLSASPVHGKKSGEEESSPSQAKHEKQDSITVVDNRTGKQVAITIEHGGFVAAENLWKLKLRLYDPGYLNTASAKSSITYIDGDKGILEYRGYPIEELAEKSSFLEVAYLLLYGELPINDQLDYFQRRVMTHSFLHHDVAQIIKSFRYDAHPVGMLATSTAALSLFFVILFFYYLI
ncbi:citrate synthase I [Reticulomyxa filosa]|uniref:Citrate synthase I n=1 Tax=Reticulomyxa filosa TaxID=46433 RepID=X6NEC1_RETFI|nr:citrate synthase I [Reticulomyxa filosa]|eukprot:ETO24238.1 citrate synthase I [Reticulomyxa filosa]